MSNPSLIKITRDAIRNDPKEIFNWYVLSCTWVWAFSGVAKGFDEGMLCPMPSETAPAAPMRAC